MGLDLSRQLSYDELYSIALRSDPKDVLNFCKVDTRFSELCRRQDFWEQLLREHFPQAAQLVNNYRRQYQACAVGVTTRYYLENVMDYNQYTTLDNGLVINHTDLKLLATLRLPKSREAEFFYIPGLPFQENEERLAMIEDSRDAFEFIVTIYNGRDFDVFLREAAIYFFNTTLERLRSYADLKYGEVNSDTVRQSVRDSNLPEPFTVDAIQEYLAINKMISFSPPIEPGYGNGDGQLITIFRVEVITIQGSNGPRNMDMGGEYGLFDKKGKVGGIQPVGFAANYTGKGAKRRIAKDVLKTQIEDVKAKVAPCRNTVAGCRDEKGFVRKSSKCKEYEDLWFKQCNPEWGRGDSVCVSAFESLKAKGLGCNVALLKK